MPTIQLHQTTTATPRQIVAGLTDFGPGRKELFGNSDDDALTVHAKEATRADVTEGSLGIWERLTYDWSDPHRITMRTTDSNTWSNESGHTYTLTPRPDGATDVTVIVVRDGKTVRGKILGFLLGNVLKGMLVRNLEKTVRAIETRHYS